LKVELYGCGERWLASLTSNCDGNEAGVGSGEVQSATEYMLPWLAMAGDEEVELIEASYEAPGLAFASDTLLLVETTLEPERGAAGMSYACWWPSS
jgi:hypothetical protein